MLWHVDALTTRWASPKFTALVNFVQFDRVNPDYLFELAVVLATPGVRVVDARNWMDRRLQLRTRLFIKRAGLDVTDLALENAASVTEADAWAMLRFTPMRSSPSLWARALIVEHGDTAVARRLGVSEKVVANWRHGSASSVLE